MHDMYSRPSVCSGLDEIVMRKGLFLAPSQGVTARENNKSWMLTGSLWMSRPHVHHRDAALSLATAGSIPRFQLLRQPPSALSYLTSLIRGTYEAGTPPLSLKFAQTQKKKPFTSGFFCQCESWLILLTTNREQNRIGFVNPKGNFCFESLSSKQERTQHR